MKVGACSCPQGDRRLSSSRAVCVGSNGETALVRVRAWSQNYHRGDLSKREFGRWGSRPSGEAFALVEVGEVPLGFAPALGGDAEGDVAVAEAVNRPVGGQDCL